jgi:hypothetical protein
MLTPLVSDRTERPMRLRRQFDADRIAGPYLAANHDNTHDAGLANELAVLVAAQRRRHQAWLYLV